MAKKELKGLDALLNDNDNSTSGQQQQNRQGRPRKYFDGSGLPPGEERASLIVNVEAWNRFKAVCYWERRTQKKLFNEIIEDYLARYEKKHGKIEPIPEGAE